MKKQVKKLSKKIMVLVLITSIIFTSCFSYKKINVHATGAVAALSAYTLYEICLYIGGLAVTTLGIGYAYENRDEIAEFGKSVIDSMIDIPEEGWFFGATSAQEDPTIYGREALVAAQMAAWAYIVTGGQSPKNDNNNDDDDDEGNEGDNGNEGESSESVNDYDKRTKELSFTNFFLTSAGVQLVGHAVESIYDKWVNKEEDNILDEKYGVVDELTVNTNVDEDGYYHYEFYLYYGFDFSNCVTRFVVTDVPCCAYFFNNSTSVVGGFQTNKNSSINSVVDQNGSSCNTSFDLSDPLANGSSKFFVVKTNMPLISNSQAWNNYLYTGEFSFTDISNLPKSYRVADWIADDDEWKGYLEDIATSLRSLQDLTVIAQALSEGALTTQPSADEYGDMMVNLGNDYAPKTDPISDPVYWPSTNTTPKLDPSVLPNYQPGVNPDPDPGTNPDNPDDGDGGGSDGEIDLDGLGSIFSILFYLIMIIIMLIYLFLACLAFIVMIFRIPASSSMLPEEMVMGFDHLKTIMIPGMNISIYGFAMALIYLLIIFTVIKILRLEINDFKFPRAGRKP